MTNKLTIAKKAFSVAVAATTILWSVGLSAFLPTAASAATFGDLIKGTTLSTVYYYGSDGQRYSFPNEKTFFSWNNDFSAVKTISDTQLAGITLAGNIAYRPGSRWIKITSDAKVYAVSTTGKVRWIENEATAKGLGGDNWNTLIDDVPDVFFTDYSVGNSLSSPAAGYDGMLWSDGTSTYLVSGAKYSLVTPAGFAANHYKAASVLKGAGFTKSGLSAGADITSGMTNLTDAAQKVTTPTYANSQSVSVALSASSPAAGTVIATQALAPLVAFDFTNPTSSPVTVKSLTLHRAGVSSDTTLSNIYLFNGFSRLTDSATVSNGIASWNDASGLFTIPAGGTATVSARSDIANVSGQTLGLSLNSLSDVGFVGAFAAAGSFPLNGALFTIASAPSNYATVDLGTALSYVAVNASATPANDYNVWQDQVTVGKNGNGAYLEAVRFRNTGSIAASDVSNWRFYVGGVQRGAAVASQDANGYVTFDLSAAPLHLNTQTHTFKVMADVTGGTTRTLTVGIRSAADLIVYDNDYKQAVLPTTTGAFSSATATAGTQTFGSGSVSITKRLDSPSADATLGASNVVLGRFDIKATGEPIKVESLNLQVVDGTLAAFGLRNGSVFLDGTQIGSTKTICGDYSVDASCTVNSGAGASYTTFTFGSSLVVYPGAPSILEVHGDMYDAIGTDNMAAGQSVQLKIAAASGNVLLKTTGNYTGYPVSTAVPAGVLNVKTGTLTLAKNTSFADKAVVLPKSAYQIASFTVTPTATEAINVSQIGVNLASGSVTTNDLENLYVTYGIASNQVSTTIKSTPTYTDANFDNSFSVGTTLQPNTTYYFNVFADISAAAAAHTINPALSLTATTVSGKDASKPATGTGVLGQTITINTSGTFVASIGSTVSAFNAQALDTVTAAKYKFVATTEDYTINEVQVKVANAAAGTINYVELFNDAGVSQGTAVFNVSTDVTDGSGSADATAANVVGLSIPVAANHTVVLTAKLKLNDIGVGLAASQKNLALTFDKAKVSDSTGAQHTANGSGLTITTDAAGQEIRAYKAIPTVTSVDLTNSTLINGQPTPLYSFKVTASSNGPVALKQVRFPLSWTDGGGAGDALTMDHMTLLRNGQTFTSSVHMLGQKTSNGIVDVADVTGASGLLETSKYLVVNFTTEDVIGANETVTYTIGGTPNGFNVTDASSASHPDYFSMYLGGPEDAVGTYAGVRMNLDRGTTETTIDRLYTSSSANDAASYFNFIWSDSSAASHSDSSTASTSDWAFGYKVLNLDLAGETWND